MSDPKLTMRSASLSEQNDCMSNVRSELHTQISFTLKAKKIHVSFSFQLQRHLSSSIRNWLLGTLYRANKKEKAFQCFECTCGHSDLVSGRDCVCDCTDLMSLHIRCMLWNLRKRTDKRKIYECVCALWRNILLVQMEKELGHAKTSHSVMQMQDEKEKSARFEALFKKNHKLVRQNDVFVKISDAVLSGK